MNKKLVYQRKDGIMDDLFAALRSADRAIEELSSDSGIKVEDKAEIYLAIYRHIENSRQALVALENTLDAENIVVMAAAGRE